MKELFAIIATILAFAGNLPYLRDVFMGKAKPHPYTWLVWSIVSGTVLFGMVAKGAGVGALPILVAEIFTILIFLSSIKFGFTDITRTDFLYLVFALSGLVPWMVTKDPTLSVLMAVGIDLVAFGPTLRKAWSHPRSENPVLYGSNVLRHVLALLSLEAYNIATTAHSVAMILANTTMTSLLFARRKKEYDGERGMSSRE